MLYETLLIDRSYYQILRIYNAFQMRFGLMGLEMGLEAKSENPDGIARPYSLNPTKSNTGYIARAHSNLLLNLTLRYPFSETCFGPNPLYALFRSFSSATCYLLLIHQTEFRLF